MNNQLKIPDRYDLGKLGPMGGQASIIHAHDKWLKRDVIMKAGLSDASYDVAKEVRALASIYSKHVVAVYDTIRDASGNIEAIVEEEVKGDMFDRVFTSDLDLDAKLRLLYQLACGVADMHASGCIHRDLKPSNMKIQADGLLKIFDLGIATILSDGDTTHIGKGTRGYKAPELFGAPPKPVSNKCDTYSIGVIAHQLLSNGVLAQGFIGKPPNPHAAGIAFGSLTGHETRLTKNLDDCLANQPTDRPDAAMLRDALAAEIVRGRHRAILVSGNTQFIVDTTHPSVKVGDGNEITVRYTGTSFIIASMAGNVFVNNRTMNQGDKLEGAMVITLGAPQMGSRRMFVTFDISHPEILV